MSYVKIIDDAEDRGFVAGFKVIPLVGLSLFAVTTIIGWLA